MRKIKYIAGALIVLLFLSSAIVIFLTRSSFIESEKIKEDLLIITQNNVNTVNFLFTEYARSLIIGSRGIESNKAFSKPEDVTHFLEHISQEGGFLCVSLDTTTNQIYTACGKTYKEKTNVPYDAIENSTIFISDSYYDELHNTQVISVRVPLGAHFEGMYLNGRISTSHLSKVLEKSFYTLGGFFHIIDNNGQYLASSDTGIELLMNYSFIEAMPMVTFEDEYDYEETVSAFLEGKSGLVKYTFDNSTRYLYFMPIGIKNWMLTTIVPSEYIEKNATLHQRAGIILSGSIVAVIIMLFIFIFLEERKSHTETLLLQKSMQTLADKTNKAIIEWDYKTHKLTSVSDYAALFGRKLVSIDIRKNAEDLPIFCKEDRATVRNVFDAILSGTELKDTRFRIKHEDGEFLWCEYSSSVVRDAKGKLIKSIAFLENIDTVVRRTEALQKDAERDSLTGVYNKVHTEALISYELENLEHKTAALFILDFDNFKPLNDTFGHHKGDEVLKETVKGLQRIFRSEDIIGRLGGDEFFIFLKSIESIDTIKMKADTVCKSLKKTYEKDGKSVTVTYSIGISLAPNHGKDFKTLYKTADKALYNVKNNGKDNFALYEA